MNVTVMQHMTKAKVIKIKGSVIAPNGSPFKSYGVSPAV